VEENISLIVTFSIGRWVLIQPFAFGIFDCLSIPRRHHTCLDNYHGINSHMNIVTQNMLEEQAYDFSFGNSPIERLCALF
jgi:hypothetical protein